MGRLWVGCYGGDHVVTESSAEKALCGGITLKQAQMLHLLIGSISESVVVWATSGAICSARSMMDIQSGH